MPQMHIKERERERWGVENYRGGHKNGQNWAFIHTHCGIILKHKMIIKIIKFL